MGEAGQARDTLERSRCPAREGGAGPGDPRESVAAGFLRLSGLVQGVVARASERHDLTMAQARMLCVLLDGPRGMAELAQFCGVEKAALTGLMDRAERRGLARRAAVPGDRRALQATLTDSGREAAAAFHADVTAGLEELAAALPGGERDRFRAAMAQIIEACGDGGRSWC